jgi:hypothetical protein
MPKIQPKPPTGGNLKQNNETDQRKADIKGNFAMLVCVLMRLEWSSICDMGKAREPRPAFLRWMPRIINGPESFHRTLRQ